MLQLEEIIEKAKKGFENIFQESAKICSFSAGRVNLIGEHVDYNDGFVMPMAIPLFTVIVGTHCSDKNAKFEICSSSFATDKLLQFSKPFALNGYPSWAAYVLGVLSLYPGNFDPFKAYIYTTVPLGGGLSSSASLETAVFRFLDDIADVKSGLAPKDIALLCQKAEHEYAKVPCGVMDQFSCALSKKGCALLLNCRNLEYEYLPIVDPNVTILVTNSNVKHELNNGEYANRRNACHKAAQLMGLSSLRDASIELLDKNRNTLGDEIYRRAKHVVSEIKRTEEAAKALKDGNYQRFGKLMIESHKSLKDDFEVSCSELDELVELALNCSGVYGSRMTGGGFGGCTVTLVDKNSAQNVCSYIKENYKGCPTFYICNPVDGSGSKSL